MDDKTLFYDLGRNSHICETDAPCCSDVICDDIASDTSQTDLLISIGINNNDDSLKINNSPLINAGVIDIDHNNLIEEQNTLSVYPIKIDKNGHISEYGDALGLVSDEQDGLMPNVDNNIDEGTLGEDDFVFNATLKKYQKLPGSIFDRGVTSVGIETDGSLTATGSPITSTGTFNLGHRNVVVPQTVSGIYPITYDENGHITASGDALEVVSNNRRGLLPSITDNTIEDLFTSDDVLFNATRLKYTKLPSTAFSDTTYEDGTTGYVLKAKQDSNGHQIDTTYAPLNNPELTGVPTAPTAIKGTNTNQIATTSFVASAVDGLASLNSPNFIGIPTAPTATKGTNTTQIATTSYVMSAVADLEGAMHYKGTVVGGNLPTVGVKNGDTYKVAEDGTYDGRQAKVGDLFIAVVDGSVVAWTYVPSADETAVTSITAGAGLTGGTITTTGTIALASSGVTPGTYQGLTIDTYGRVTGAQNMNYGNWVKPTLATNNNTYYLTGIQTTSSTDSTIYNTYISDTNSGVKYVSDTTNGGKMYVDNNEVTVGLFYAIN